jgi:hypothetical protein
MATAEDFRETWYEEAIASRERALANVLGPSSPANQVFKPADQNLELKVPGFAFLRYPPGTNRRYWLFVSHGFAQPAEFRDFCEGFAGDGSGYGFEFALATAAEETWPFSMLEFLSLYFLNSGRKVYAGDRIPASDLMVESAGGALMALPSPTFAAINTLTGSFNVVQLVGITAGELEKARSYPGRVGSRVLESVLKVLGIGGVTDRNRECTTRNPDFDRIWLEESLKIEPEALNSGRTNG